MDYLAITGLRSDGRLPTEHRRVNVELGVHSSGDGSALFELGLTKVWATCRGPRESSTTTGVYVEVAAPGFASTDRRRFNKTDRRAKDLAQTLERAFANVVQTRTFPKSRVDLQVRILQNDGGLAWASFNACSLALMDAGVPMRDLCIACGVAYADRTVLIDPSTSENLGLGNTLSGGELWMAIAPREDKIVTTVFNGKVSSATMDSVLQAAHESCQQLHSVVNAFVTAYYKPMYAVEEANEFDEEDLAAGMEEE
jgi:exosome complex component RRP41